MSTVREFLCAGSASCRRGCCCFVVARLVKKGEDLGLGWDCVFVPFVSCRGIGQERGGKVGPLPLFSLFGGIVYVLQRLYIHPSRHATRPLRVVSSSTQGVEVELAVPAFRTRETLILSCTNKLVVPLFFESGPSVHALVFPPVEAFRKFPKSCDPDEQTHGPEVSIRWELAWCDLMW